MTVRDIINGSLRLLGVVASGEQCTGAEAEDALASLNDMLDSWSTERLMVYAILPQTFPLVAGKLSYAMGPGGDFNVARPVEIDQLSLIYTGNGAPQPLNLPIEILNLDQYQALVLPTTQSTITQAVYIDDAMPARNLLFYPVPQIGYSVQIFCWTAVTAFDDVTDDVVLPPGYARALRFNLAVELAPEYGVQPSASVLAAASEGRANVKRKNIKPLYMSCDQALVAVGGASGTFNILTGQ